MPDTLPFELHFLRPLWLLALIPVAAIVILIAFRRRPENQWGDVIAPNLLKHLLVKPDHRWRVDPLYSLRRALSSASSPCQDRPGDASYRHSSRTRPR